MASKDGRQARWDAHNRERRLAILEAACAVIEDGEPGAEFHVQQIAARAGLNRTVVYRHFADRADLDEQIRAHIIEQFVELMGPQVTLDVTINETIRRIITTYVDWTTAHPALHAVAMRESTGAFTAGIGRIATMLVEVLELALSMLGAELRPNDAEMLEPLAYGLIGAVLATVQRWSTRQPRRPEAREVAELLTQSVWNLLNGHARRLGLELDPDQPLVDLLAIPEDLRDVVTEPPAS